MILFNLLKVSATFASGETEKSGEGSAQRGNATGTKKPRSWRGLLVWRRERDDRRSHSVPLHCPEAVEPTDLSRVRIFEATATRSQPEATLFGGERGIRTLDTLPYTHFPGVLLQPLGHLSRTSQQNLRRERCARLNQMAPLCKFRGTPDSPLCLYAFLRRIAQ